MKTRHWLAVCLFACSLPTMALAGSWSMYLWDPSHSSYNAAETILDGIGVQSLAPLSTFHALGGFAAAPTVINGTAFVGDWAGYFHSIRASDGHELWRQFVGMAATPVNPSCQPAVGVSGQAVLADDVVYVPGGDSAVYALNQRSGSIRWRVSLADPAAGSYLWSSLTLVGNFLYVGVASLGDCPVVRGAVVRIDINDPNNPKFFYLDPVGQIGGGVWSSPALDTNTNTVYITSGNGAFDPSSGLWGGVVMSLDGATMVNKSNFESPNNSPDADLDWGSSTTLFQSANGTPLVAATGKDGILYGLRRGDLSEVWTTQVALGCDIPQSGCGSLSTPAFDGQRLYLGAGKSDANASGNGSLYAIDPSTGEKIWSNSLPDPVLAPVTVANGVVYASTLGGLMAFGAENGELLWSDGGRGPIFSQPVVVDGFVFSTYASGEMVVWGVANGDSGAPGTGAPWPARRR